jgi:hypothetical protein
MNIKTTTIEERKSLSSLLLGEPCAHESTHDSMTRARKLRMQIRYATKPIAFTPANEMASKGTLQIHDIKYPSRLFSLAHPAELAPLCIKRALLRFARCTVVPIITNRFGPEMLK